MSSLKEPCASFGIHFPITLFDGDEACVHLLLDFHQRHVSYLLVVHFQVHNQLIQQILHQHHHRHRHFHSMSWPQSFRRTIWQNTVFSGQLEHQPLHGDFLCQLDFRCHCVHGHWGVFRGKGVANFAAALWQVSIRCLPKHFLSLDCVLLSYKQTKTG